MIVDKPAWVTHQGSMYSIDIDPTGQRLATCGIDCKVRMWSMAPILSHAAETVPTTPRALAVLHEHYASVSVVRFSPNGRLLASGNDDKLTLIHELKPGSGSASFGSSEAPSLENWRVQHTLRGHGNNVTDLAWSPDGSLLASCSLDNTVIIWEVATGRQMQILRGHVGFVKGLAWDPFGKYLASQGDDGIVIWRVDEWTQVSKVGADTTAMANMFFQRLSWSPDGQVLSSTCSMKGNQNVSLFIDRRDFTTAFALVGHRAAVTVARWNPRFFFAPSAPSQQKQPQNLQNQPQQAVQGPVALPNGHKATAAAADDEDAEVRKVICLGSSDRTFSVWDPSGKRPILCGNNFCKGAVLDACWTPDGYTLLVCSSDGSITVCTFDASELGRVVPDMEVRKLLAVLSGGAVGGGGRGGVGGRKALAEAPELIALEPDNNKKARRNAPESATAGIVGGGVAASGAQAAAAAASAPHGAAMAGTIRTAAASLPLQNGQAAAHLHSLGAGASAAAGSDAAGQGPTAMVLDASPLSRVMQGHGVGAAAAAPQRHMTTATAAIVTAPSAAAVRGQVLPSASTRVVSTSAPSAQGPAQQAAGRLSGPQMGPPQKRAAPTAVPPPFSSGQPAARPASFLFVPPAATQALLPLSQQGQQLSHQSGAAADGALADGGVGAAVRQWLATPAVKPLLSVELYVRQRDTEPDISECVVLEASNSGRDYRTAPVSDLVCSVSGRQLWSDRLPGSVVALGGSAHFSVACTSMGDLQLYTPAGRRSFPALRLGSTTAFLATDGQWRLLLVATDGVLRLWDVHAMKVLLKASLAPLLHAVATTGAAPSQPPSPVSVANVRLSKSGAPLVVLSNCYAYTYVTALEEWARVADDSYPASAFTSSLLSNTQGELARLQAQAASTRTSSDVVNASLQQTQAAHERNARTHAESNIAAALVLNSPLEWKRWLQTYVRTLANSGDEVRLREVMSDLLGPLRWSAETHTGDPASVPGHAATTGAALASGASCSHTSWQPVILGFQKRSILRDVMREVARNREHQHLLLEFQEQLKSAEEWAAAVSPAAAQAAASAAVGIC